VADDLSPGDYFGLSFFGFAAFAAPGVASVED
jgi:hypothetical protein